MHRQRVRLASRVPLRAQPALKVVERSGIVATYGLHEHVLSNRSARRRFAERPPVLDDLQRRIVDGLETDGYATVPFGELIAEADLQQAVERQGAEFIAETERGLREEAEGDGARGLRRRKGKEFLVRAHSFDGVRVGLDHAWFRACVSPRMLDIANSYLRMWAKVSYVDLWYTVPQGEEAERSASQLWHFDFDDKYLLKAFLYFDDVDERTGPFEYVAGSQPGGRYHGLRPWRPMGYGRATEEDIERGAPADAVRTFTAPRGTLIFCNTSGLHRGGFATERPRILATATYCSSASLAALSERNYEIDPGALDHLTTPARYAVS